MNNTPFVVEGNKKEEKVKSTRDLITVNGHYTPEGLIYRGKRIVAGIFVNVTGKSEEEKKRAFELAKEELGEEAEGLELYETIDL